MPLNGDRTAERLRFASRLALRHLLVSIAVALLSASVVFGLWYPDPADDLLEVGHVYWILLLVDAACGPLLTLLLASPFKSNREMLFDLGCVISLQVAALLFGLRTLEAARPIAYVLEQDRVVLVGKNEIYSSGCNNPCNAQFSFSGIAWKISQVKTGSGHQLSDLDLSLQGVSPAMRPEAWTSWAWRDSRVQRALHPMTDLSDKQEIRLRSLGMGDLLRNEELRFIPLVSSKTLEWVLIFNASGVPVAAAPIDGFER